MVELGRVMQPVRRVTVEDNSRLTMEEAEALCCSPVGPDYIVVVEDIEVVGSSVVDMAVYFLVQSVGQNTEGDARASR